MAEEFTDPDDLSSEADTMQNAELESYGRVDVQVHMVRGREAGDPPGEQTSVVQERKGRIRQSLQISSEGVSSEGVEQLRDCILKADDVFTLEPSELGEVVKLQHRIDTAESKPVRQPPRRIPFVLRPEVRRMIDDMLQTGDIQESSSPWASQVVLVRKQDQTLRFARTTDS